MGFFTLEARLVFIESRKAFIKAPIFYYLDPKYNIWIETDTSGYVVRGVLSQLVLDKLDQWHLVVFFSQKIILSERYYKTYNGKLLAIIEVFKI